jgi:arylsulfatase A-like enzyme
MWINFLATVIGFWISHSAVLGASATRANVLLIVADDLGYGDVGVHGGKDIPTPNIDALAAGGTRFTSGYVTCPVCSPTRAGLLTGRYQQRFGHEFNPGPQAAANFGLPLTEPTLADALRAAGYRTGLVGKWHLGGRPDYVPTKRGFDEFYGFLAGAHAYLPAGQGRRAPIFRGTDPVPPPDYLTDAFGDEAVAFVKKHASEPYFLYLAFNAVHNPEQATPKYLDRFPNLAEGRRTYAAKLSAMDDAIGRVTAALRETGQDNGTLVFFISDNGGPPANHSTNGPLGGQKGNVMEGGIRVPFIMKWPGKVPAGKVLDQPVISLDIFPTALAAAGVEAPKEKKPDGVNLLPLLTGNAGASTEQLAQRPLFWRFGQLWAVRLGDWKLLSTKRGQLALYNLKQDIAEKNDVSPSEPQRVKALQSTWDHWNAQLEKPRWQRQQARANRTARRATTD